MLMDACHCPGAVMFLFRGKMGTVLHTGDFRFSESMLENPIMFPVSNFNAQKRGISIEVDTLFLDNTFADPTYDFPAREEAYSGLKDIVKQHKDYRIFIFSYYLGKEEVFINLAQDFETLVSTHSEANPIANSLRKVPKSHSSYRSWSTRTGTGKSP
jgi:DNA cross-link repair 1B protein